MTLMQLVVIVLVVTLGTPLIAWLVIKAAEQDLADAEAERQALIKQRQRFDRIVQASEMPPRAPGLHHKRIS